MDSYFLGEYPEECYICFNKSVTKKFALVGSNIYCLTCGAIAKQSGRGIVLYSRDKSTQHSFKEI